MSSPATAAVLDPARLADHLPRLTRVATRITGSRDAADDLVQDTLERVLRSPRRPAGDEFSYLVRSLRNRHIDRLRAAQRRPRTTVFDDALDAVLAGRERADASLEARAVLAAVADLPEGYRDVVVAVDVLGTSYAETAETLGIPVGTVMSRLSRGRAQVARAIGPR